MEPQFDDAPWPVPDFDPSAWRFFIADRSNFLFIEADDATDIKLSEDLVSRVESLAEVVDARTIILIDDAHRIDACVRAEVFPSRPERLHLGISLHTLALTPRLLEEFPAWHRTPSAYHGFSTVHFDKPLTSGTTTTVNRILKFLTRLAPPHSVARLHIDLDPAGLRAPTPSFTSSSTSRPGDAGHGDANDAIEHQLGIRKRLRESIPMLDATSWGKLRGASGSNPAASLSKYKTNGRLFSISEGRRDLYPQFQFDDNAAPLPVIAEILRIAPPDARGWPLLSWFDAGNVLLGGRSPRELLRQNPERVKLAAVDYYSSDE